LKNKKYEGVIKSILRVYQGSFEYPVSVDEGKLSKFLKIDVKELKKQFAELHKFDIIKYIPTKNKPQLTYLLPRENADDLVLDTKRLNFLKERYRININSILDYAEKRECRQIQLLNYFGEEVEKCGTCDICRKIYVSGMDEDEVIRLKNKIKNLLLKEQLNKEQIVESFHQKTKPKIIKLLSYLMDEGYIHKDSDQLTWPDPKK